MKPLHTYQIKKTDSDKLDEDVEQLKLIIAGRSKQMCTVTKTKHANLRLNSLNCHVPKKNKSMCSPKVMFTMMLTAGFFHNSHKVETIQLSVVE